MAGILELSLFTKAYYLLFFFLAFCWLNWLRILLLEIGGSLDIVSKPKWFVFL